MLKTKARAVGKDENTVNIAQARNLVRKLIVNDLLDSTIVPQSKQGQEKQSIKRKLKYLLDNLSTTKQIENVANEFTRVIDEEEAKWFGKNRELIKNLKNEMQTFIKNYINPSLKPEEWAIGLSHTKTGHYAIEIVDMTKIDPKQSIQDQYETLKLKKIITEHKDGYINADLLTQEYGKWFVAKQINLKKSFDSQTNGFAPDIVESIEAVLQEKINNDLKKGSITITDLNLSYIKDVDLTKLSTEQTEALQLRLSKLTLAFEAAKKSIQKQIQAIEDREEQASKAEAKERNKLNATNSEDFNTIMLLENTARARRNIQQKKIKSLKARLQRMNTRIDRIAEIRDQSAKLITPQKPSAPEVEEKDGNKTGEGNKESSPETTSSSLFISKQELQEATAKKILDNPEVALDDKDIQLLTPEIIEALNQKYESDPTLYINLETLRKLPTSLGRLLDKKLISNSVAHTIDISKPFNVQFERDAEILPEEMIKNLKPFVSKKVNEEFLQNPDRSINEDYISMISPDTLEKLSENQQVNPKTITLMSIPQLNALPKNILTNYLTDQLNLSKPLEQQFFKNLQYFLIRKTNDQVTNEKIGSIEQSFLPKLKEKINRAFKENPKIELDPSYVEYISTETLKNFNPELISNIPNNIFQKMNLKQIQALDVNQLSLNQLNALFEMGNQEIILYVLKKISDFSAMIKKSTQNIAQRTGRHIDAFLEQLSDKQLQELAEQSKDELIQPTAQEFLKKRSIPIRQRNKKA